MPSSRIPSNPETEPASPALRADPPPSEPPGARGLREEGVNHMWQSQQQGLGWQIQAGSLYHLQLCVKLCNYFKTKS